MTNKQFKKLLFKSIKERKNTERQTIHENLRKEGYAPLDDEENNQTTISDLYFTSSLASNNVNAKIWTPIATSAGPGMSGIQDKSPSIELEVDGQLLGKEESLQMYIKILIELRAAAKKVRKRLDKIKKKYGEDSAEYGRLDDNAVLSELSGYENIFDKAPKWKYGNPKTRNSSIIYDRYEDAALGLLAYADVKEQFEDWGAVNQISTHVDRIHDKGDDENLDESELGDINNFETAGEEETLQDIPGAPH